MNNLERKQDECPPAHPPAEQLNAFVLGQLGDDASAEVERHLATCETCAEQLTTLPDDPLVDLFRQAQAMTPDTPAEKYDFLAPALRPEELGRLGAYSILHRLGSGGMGIVFVAEDADLQRRVALKVMNPALASKAAARERFLREARSMAKLSHPGIVTIHHVGQDRGVPFLVMELLEGESLDEHLKREGKLSVADALRIGREIAEGLAAAHRRGLIHRDIKPGNIWLDSRHQGHVKLLDFGLARGDGEEVRLTQSGAIVGTPAYMAPEQARGDQVDHRCDLFSLGAVLYRLTTGQLPFRGDNTMSILSALALDSPKPPRAINADIPPRLAVLIERLLSKDRGQRPATAQTVAEELAAIEREVSQPSPEAPTVPIRAATVRERAGQTALSRSRLRWLAAASLLLLLGAVAAAIVVIVRDKQGNKIAEIDVPPEGKIEIQDKANKPLPESVRIEPEPLAPLAAGEPLSPFALVLRPAKLPGVRSWSIATREPWIPSGVAYRPDSKRLAVGSWAGTVHIWEAKSGRLLRVLFSQGGVVSLAWSPDGRVLAVGTGLFKRAVQLWDADTGRLLRALETPRRDFIYALTWSSDGRKVRAWGTDVHCCTWDVASGKLLSSPRIVCQVDRPAFSPDGQRLAGTGDGNRILIWDAETGKEVSQLSSPAAVRCLTWSPNGKRLACTGPDGLRVWDVERGKNSLHCPKAVQQDGPPIWSPDGRSLAFNLERNQGTVLIDAASAEELRRLDDGGNAWMAWSPDGRTIARINGEPWVRLYDAFTGERRITLCEGINLRGVAASPNLQTLAVSDRFDTFLVSADTGQPRGELKQTIWPLAFSPDGKRLASQGPGHAVQVGQADGKLALTLGKHKGEVTSLAWSPDGKRLASSAAGEKRVLIWDAVKGKRDRELGPFPCTAQSVKWSADGRLLTFHVPEVGWHIWDLEKGVLANDPKKWKVFWLDLTPDGRSALTAPSATDVYRLRDLASGKDGARLPHTPSLYLTPPTWSADGRTLAVTFPGGIELWRADLSKRLRRLPLVAGANQVLVSHNGKRLMAQTGERLLAWETDTGRLRGLLLVGRRHNALTITADGHYTGNEKVNSSIVMVVEKDDGTQEMLEPADFEKKYGFPNHSTEVRLIDK